MAFRVVMVKFVDDVTKEDVSEFKSWLNELAKNTPYVVNMYCGQHTDVDSENSLDMVAPNASFHDFVSVWEFEDVNDIESFILEPFHHAMAGSKFKKIVAHRHVVNFS